MCIVLLLLRKVAPLFEAENEDEFDHVYEEKNGIQKSTTCGRLAHLCNSEEEYILIDENTNGINTSESRFDLSASAWENESFIYGCFVVLTHNYFHVNHNLVIFK